jgi:predicted transcriptional regulator
MPQKDNSTTLFFGYEIKSDFNTLGKILASPNKKKILYSLNFPKTLKEITIDTDLNFSTISRNVKELENLSLIKINNKDYRKGKIVSISNKGTDIMLDLKNRQKIIEKESASSRI